jgi:hypothetical protein
MVFFYGNARAAILTMVQHSLKDTGAFKVQHRLATAYTLFQMKRQYMLAYQ